MRNKQEKRVEQMRHEIMTTIRANELPVTADMWFRLIFMTEQNLKKMCRELNIVLDF